MTVNLKNNNLLGAIITFIIMLIILLVIGSVLKSRQDDSEKINIILEERLSAKKQELEQLRSCNLKEKDSLYNIISNREQENEELKTRFSVLEKEVQSEINKDKPIIFHLPGMSKFVNDRYKTEENYNDSISLILAENTAKEVLIELQENDTYKKIIPLKDEQILNQSQQIFNLEKDKTDIKLHLTSLEKEIKFQTELQFISEESNRNLNKQLKIANKRKNLNKILIPVGIAVGIFTGYQIAK